MAEKLSVLSRLRYAFNRCNFPLFCLKPLQVKCFEYLLKGKTHMSDIRSHFKPTETFQYTNFYSCHENYSQRTFEENIRDFAARLKNRGYPAPIVEKHLSEVKFSERKTSLQNKNRTAETKILPFITQYHSALTNLKEILNGKWHLIQNQPQLRNTFKEPAPFYHIAKEKSLKDNLVKAKL